MARIQILDAQIAQSIAAGEVVERPASIVKELVENAIDAGADRVQIFIEQGGIKSIRIVDNGFGMDNEEALLAFQDHATSKMRDLSDLDRIQSFGFRGEALPTIAAVSKVRLISKTADCDSATLVQIDGGELRKHEKTSGNLGTQVEVRDLFYNTPARFKFLKQDKTEASKITELVQELALSRPDVSFRLENQGKEILHTPGDNHLMSAIYAVFGQELAKNMVPILEGDLHESIRVEGYISKPSFARKSRTWQLFYVNDRSIQSPILTRAVEDAFKSTMMIGKYPACVLKLQIPGNLVDVNVHPRKLEVRFWNDSQVYRQVYHQVQNSLFTALRPQEIVMDADDEEKDQGQENQYTSNSSYQTLGNKENEAKVNDTNASQPEVPSTPAATEKKSFLQFDLGAYASLRKKIDEEEKVLEKEQNESFASKEDTIDNKLHNEDASEYSTEEEASHHYTQETNSLTREQVSFLAENEEHDEDPLACLRHGRFVGELFRTYLLFEYKDSFVILDQHAAHEKILFEEAVNLYHRENRIVSEQLLQAEEMQVSPSDILLLESVEEEIKGFGFDFTFLSNNKILLRAVPVSRQLLDPISSFRYVLDEVQAHGIEGVRGESDFIYMLLTTSSCKAAVKAHDRLHIDEVEALRRDLLLLDNPYHCPHGRPVLLKMEAKNLEKLFKRIV